MKVFILLDKKKIVRCIASNWKNLHGEWSEDKNLSMYLVESGGICGDEYDPDTGQWTARPENYPKPSNEDLIAAEIERIREQRDRSQAIENLKQRGELSADF